MPMYQRESQERPRSAKGRCPVSRAPAATASIPVSRAAAKSPTARAAPMARGRIGDGGSGVAEAPSSTDELDWVTSEPCDGARWAASRKGQTGAATGYMLLSRAAASLNTSSFLRGVETQAPKGAAAL